MNFIKKIKEKGFFHIVTSNFLNKIIQFCSGIFLVRILSKSEFGVYSYTQNILNLAILFSGLGVLQGLIQFGSESNTVKLRNAYFRYGIKIGVIFNLFLGFLLLLYPFIFKIEFDDAILPIITLVFLPIFMFLVECIQIYLRSSLFNRQFSILNTTNTFLIFICTIFGASILGVQGVFMFLYIANSLTICIGYFFIKKHIIIKNQNSLLRKEEKREFVNFSVISMFSYAISQFVYLLDIFIMGWIIKDTNLIASYKTATLIPFALNFIPSSIMTFLYPYFAKNREDKMWIATKYKLMTSYLFLFNLLIASTLFICAPIIIKLLFGTQYLDAVKPFRILSIAFLITSSFRVPSGNILVMVKKVKSIFYVNFAVGIFNIILDVIMIYYYSLNGAAYTVLIVVLVQSIAYKILLKKYLNE